MARVCLKQSFVKFLSKILLFKINTKKIYLQFFLGFLKVFFIKFRQVSKLYENQKFKTTERE